MSVTVACPDGSSMTVAMMIGSRVARSVTLTLIFWFWALAMTELSRVSIRMMLRMAPYFSFSVHSWAGGSVAWMPAAWMSCSSFSTDVSLLT